MKIDVVLMRSQYDSLCVVEADRVEFFTGQGYILVSKKPESVEFELIDDEHEKSAKLAALEAKREELRDRFNNDLDALMNEIEKVKADAKADC